MAKRIRMLLKKLEYKLEGGFDFIFDEKVLDVGAFVFDLFTVTVSLYYAITNKMPIIPQWAWFGIFIFMLIAGTYSLENVVYTGVEELEEDDEIVDD